jgi:hypothetical protein
MNIAKKCPSPNRKSLFSFKGKLLLKIFMYRLSRFILSISCGYSCVFCRVVCTAEVKCGMFYGRFSTMKWNYCHSGPTDITFGGKFHIYKSHTVLKATTLNFSKFGAYKMEERVSESTGSISLHVRACLAQR